MAADHLPVRKLVMVTLFAVAFGFVESSVVVYLRALYYPEGFSFPLKMMNNEHAVVELCREAATIIMLGAVAFIAGRKGWQRFGYFCLAFGVWDVFYYVWLKVILNWPVTLADWDILFLIPLPWVGPVISAALVALTLVVCGIGIVIRTSLQQHFHPTLLSWLAALAGAASILLSYMVDAGTILRGAAPAPYHYELLLLGLALFGAGYILACRATAAGR